MTPSVGDVLCGDWRLDAPLGEGGMATVFAATHRNGRRGAVKILKPAAALDANIRERFKQEARTANRISHTGAVEVFDDDVDASGAVFLVMELLEGQSLEELAELQPGNRLPPSQVALVAAELLEVMSAAHAEGIVHRDVKPANVFFTRHREVKVLDFGIARIGERSGSSNATQTGWFMGTPAYCAPEQAHGLWDQVDHRTDIWAVGATMFALLTGRAVHHAETMNQVLLLAMTASAPPVRSVVDTIPAPLAAVVDRALARDAALRFQSADEMHAAVEAAILEQGDSLGDELTLALVAKEAPPARETVPGVPLVASATTQASAPLGISALPNLTADTNAPVTPGRGTQPAPSSRWAALVGAVAMAGILGLAFIGIRALADQDAERDVATSAASPGKKSPTVESAEPSNTPAPDERSSTTAATSTPTSVVSAEQSARAATKKPAPRVRKPVVTPPKARPPKPRPPRVAPPTRPYPRPPTNKNKDPFGTW